MCEYILNYEKYNNNNNNTKDSQGHSSVISCTFWKAEEASLKNTCLSRLQGPILAEHLNMSLCLNNILKN